MEHHDDTEYEYIVPNSIAFSKDGKYPSRELKINTKDMANKFIKNTEKTPLEIQPKDKLCNCIGLGGISFGFGFLTYGLALAGAYELDALVFTIIFFNGGIGQITMGILQFYNGFSFYSAVYLVNGFYLCILFLFHFISAKVPDMQYENSTYCIFNSFFFVYGLFLLISSFKINKAFIAQIFCYDLFLLLSSIGYGMNKNSSVKISGVFAVASGVVSFYIGCGLILRKGGSGIMPFCEPLKPQNGFDK